MSSIKSQEAKLSAIYSLGFYKKQNSWNLSSSRKAKKPPQKSPEIKQNLNVIENQKPEEQSDPHNTAFVDTGSDKKNHEDRPESWDPSAVKEQNAQSTLDPINDYCEKRSNSQCVTQLGTPKTRTLKRLQELKKAILDFREKTNAEDRPESLESEDASVERNVGNEDCFWVSPTDAMDGLHYPEDVTSPADWRHGLFGDMTWNEAESANHPQEPEDWSVDSEGEFMRGAHEAPHSTETELELPPDLTTSDVSSSSLWRLSSLQLMQAVQQHSLVLQKLLQERKHRQNLRVATPLISTGSSIEDFLSWNVGPKNRGRGDTLTMDTSYKDVLITGSYRNVVGVGRGRGRIIVW